MTHPPEEMAREVAEDLLQRTAHALMTQDFDAFADCFELPQVMTTTSARVIARTRTDLRRTFSATCAHFREAGVTELRRTCEAADFQNETVIAATHISEVLVGDRHLLPPYPVFSLIRRDRNGWRIASSDYMLDEGTPQADALAQAEANDPEALQIYQAHLDACSEALMSRDFDRFRDRIQLPHRITTETDQIVIETVEQMRDTFTAYSSNYLTLGMTQFIRTAVQARFWDTDEIRGVHISHKLRHQSRLAAPYPNRVRLVRGPDGTWRETHCANAILNTAETFQLWSQLAETPRLPELDISSERT